MHSVSLHHLSLASLKSLADVMAQTLPTQLCIGLVGTLGAGKTTLVQQIAESLGLDAANVTSPTFTLLNSYEGSIAAGPIHLHHLDVYRIVDEDEFLELGVDELLEDRNAWVLIEWADRVESVMPPSTLWMHIDFEQGDPGDSSSEGDGDIQNARRRIELRTADESLSALLPVLKNRVDTTTPPS